MAVAGGAGVAVITYQRGEASFLCGEPTLSPVRLTTGRRLAVQSFHIVQGSAHLCRKLAVGHISEVTKRRIDHVVIKKIEHIREYSIELFANPFPFVEYSTARRQPRSREIWPLNLTAYELLHQFKLPGDT